MQGPLEFVCGADISGYRHIETIYRWDQGGAYLSIEEVMFAQRPGAILCYYNPPVHQVGNPALDAYLAGLAELMQLTTPCEYLLLYSANDPVHAGGDLKESRQRLEQVRVWEKKHPQASAEERAALYSWADQRLAKGVKLHATLRSLARRMRLIAVCGGGTRYGGSAEIALMADYLVADARSAICFSEAMIGLIPGWAGVARSLVKAGLTNTRYMTQTAAVLSAAQLQACGIYNVVVPIAWELPRKRRTADREADRQVYQQSLAANDRKTGYCLLPAALELAVCADPAETIRPVAQRCTLATEQTIALEVRRRQNPQTYAQLWGQPLREVADEIARLGRPLAPQSIAALEELLHNFNAEQFDEAAFVQQEALLDGRLYRDPRLYEGLVATLEQRVADYRLPQEGAL